MNIKLKDCVWVYGESIYDSTHNARTEIDAIKQNGWQTFAYRAGVNLSLLRYTGRHVILFRLHPAEMNQLKPLFKARGNFSVCYDDWWIMPHWFTRHATFVGFKRHSHIAIRTQEAKWTQHNPPLFGHPLCSAYAAQAAVLRPAALGLAPMINAANCLRRELERSNPPRYLYFPYSVLEKDLPLMDVCPEYDIINEWSTCGVFLMRDPFVPFGHSFANLYSDRLKLTKLLKKEVFSFLHCRSRRWDDYVSNVRASRYALVTGGLFHAFNPKYLECAILGTPMFGTSIPGEAPWIDDCMYKVDAFLADKNNIASVFERAIEAQPVLRNKCLSMRDRLLQMYNPHVVLDMLQTQLDGGIVPKGYISNL